MSRLRYQGVSDQSKAAQHRLDDAKVLLAALRRRGAMYMAGYAIECTLKAKLMRKYDQDNLLDLEDELRKRKDGSADARVFTHGLEELLMLADGMTRLRQNEGMWRTFNLANGWTPSWRYSPEPSSPEDAEDFLAAVVTLKKWIENNL